MSRCAVLDAGYHSQEKIVDELEKYIEDIHNEPFNILSNNCIHKHTRIVRKARELGHDASMMGCISVIPIRPAAGIPLIGPHFYAKVDGKTVDVSMQPSLEESIGKNEDMFKLFPVNVSKLRPMNPEEGLPLPCGLGIRWPWAKK